MRLPTRHHAPLHTTLRRAAPVVLISVGVMLLNGCFTVPATKQFQTNGNRLPETRIAKKGADKVILGETLIEDAIARITEQVGFKQVINVGYGTSSRSTVAPGWMWTNWTIDDSGREFGILYNVRAATDIYPLCFSSAPRSQPYFFILRTDEQRRVIAAEAVEARKRPQWLLGRRGLQPLRWFELFDEPARAKLREAGVLPEDEVLKQMPTTTPPPPVRPTPGPVSS